MIRRLQKRLGYRGLFLSLFGAMFVLIGAGVPFGATGGRPDPLLFHTLIAIPISIVLWSGVGLFAIVGAVVKPLQVGASALLITAPLLRFLSYAKAFYVTWWDRDLTAALRWVPISTLYFLISLTILLLSSWPEPLDDPPPPPPLTPEAQAALDKEIEKHER